MDGYRQRLLIIVALVSTTLYLIIWTNFLPSLGFELHWPTLLGNNKRPDFSLYKALDTLSVEEFPLDPSNRRRTLIVGDIHGMNSSFHSLLTTLDYNDQTDSLIHVGDIIAKGPFKGSMAVLSYMAANNVTGVRGNHDQKVIEWRGWIDWIRKFHEGNRWLLELERKWDDADVEEDDLEDWTEEQMKKTRSRWWKTIPKGWQLFGEHYKIARAMSKDEYAYLLSLPLKLHIPHAHAFIVHAGLLPSDPRLKASDRRQPLAHVPNIGQRAQSKHSTHIERLRNFQELSVVGDIKQNTDPWINLNMRGVLKNHDITRGKEGKPWSKLWNRDMSRCDGFGLEEGLSTSKKKGLPCYPSTVVYGHAATRGLDIKRWSLGLDTGCVYGRSLTALVLGSHHTGSSEDAQPHHPVIPFGDDSKGRLVTVECE